MEVRTLVKPKDKNVTFNNMIYINSIFICQTIEISLPMIKLS